MEEQHFYKTESETKRSRRLNVSNICIISEWQLHPEKSSLVNRCISGPQRVLWVEGGGAGSLRSVFAVGQMQGWDELVRVYAQGG